MNRTFVMLTFDLEEFDIPQEYGQMVSDSDQMDVSIQGLDRLLRVLDTNDIKATFFTTGNFANQNQELVRLLSVKHEIASHALYHSPNHQFENEDIIKSKKIIESITGKEVKGFRMPRLKPFDHQILLDCGIRYDSSINPTYLPGRYNLLSENALPSLKNGLIELPCSTTPLLRFPLFWLSFKNLPIGIYTALCKRTLKKNNNLMLYFHPWEFANIDKYTLPRYVKSPNGQKLTNKLDQLIRNLRETNTEFVTCDTYCDFAFPDVNKN